jgi:predicted DNA-binding transcriptional regulator AlpA
MPVNESATVNQARRLIDADQVAVKLGMSRRQVFRAADAGMIPFGVRVGRLRRWDEVVLDGFIAGGCRPVRAVAQGVRP